MAADDGLAPRRAALAILEQVRAGRPFDAALEQSLRPLLEPDRRLAHELAARQSHRDWLVRRWRQRFGPDDTARLLQWNNSRPPLVIQPARASGDALLRRLAAGGIRAAPAPWGAGLAVGASRPDQLPG